MPGAPRSLPVRPSLRFLKLEAKRRLASGEFPALHAAQAAIAAEYGLSSWASLKALVSGGPDQDGSALSHLRWVIARFRDADQPSWAHPDDDELRQHFGEPLLSASNAPELIATIVRVAPLLRGDLVVVAQTPLSASVRIIDWRFDATVEKEPPHRMTALRGVPEANAVTDPRLAAPPHLRTLGDVPAAMIRMTDESFTEMGLVALVVAGGDPAGSMWVAAKGWANLDRGELLDPGHRFPTPGVSALVTATAVLRLVADGRIGLDAAANDYLRTVRLADDSITVRELLSHTGGVDSPPAADMFAETVPDLMRLLGPVVGCSGTRGVVQPGNGEYAVLGQAIADVTALPYTEAVTRMVLEPLAMSASSFPTRMADLGPAAVIGYHLTSEGVFAPVRAMICTIPAVGGLWATPAEIMRLATGWSSLLPATLAREALTAQTTAGSTGHGVGLGWLIAADGQVAVHAGAGPGATASLTVGVRDNRVNLALTSRLIPLNPINERVLRSWATHPPSDTAGELPRELT